MDYIVDGKTFTVSYRELREQYHRFVQMPDEEFLRNVPAAAHLACIICYVKEVPGNVCLSDKGVVHELIHLLHIPDVNTSTLAEIRDVFKITLKLD